jgi:hypothetical protein
MPAANSTASQDVGIGPQPAAPARMRDEPALSLAFDPARILAEERVDCAEDVVRALLDLYLPGPVRSDVMAKLVAFVADGNPAKPAIARRVRETVHAILSMVEYQLA